MKPKNLFEVTLPDGRIVEFRELQVSEMGDVLGSGRGSTEAAQSFAVKLTGLRYAIVGVAGKPVTPADLVGSKWDDTFSTRDTLLLMSVWSQVHEPSAEAADRVGKSVRAKATGT